MKTARTPARFNDRSMAMMGIPDLPEAAFGGNLPPHERKALVRAMGIQPAGGGGGGGLGGILAVAVAIAVPIAAPYVATSIFGSATLATTMASGAFLGAAGAKLTGGDPLRGAIMGGIGGGINQYFNPGAGAGGVEGLFGSSSTPAATGNTLSSASATGSGVPSGGVNYSLTSGGTPSLAAPSSSTFTTGADYSLAPTSSGATGGSFVGGGNATNTLGSGLSSSNVSYDLAANAGGTPTLSNPTGAATYSLTAPTPTGGAPTTLNAGLNAPPAQKGVTDVLAERWAQPDRRADMAMMMGIQTGGQLIGAALAPDSSKQIEQYQQELKALQGKDEAAYQAKLKEYESFVAQAKAVSPEFFGQQSANAAAIKNARQIETGLRDVPRGSSQAYADAERRRANIGASMNTSTAYSQGYGLGLDTKNSMLSKASSMYPSTPRNYLDGMRTVSDMYANDARNRAESARGMSQMFGSLAYPMMGGYNNSPRG